jgi:hypothetical protein
LLHGEDSGVVVQVVAAREPTYKVTCADAHTLLRCAFHLGNRHTQAQVGDGYLRIRADAVLKDMLAGLGATVIAEDAAFEPESGAYGGGHSHGEHGGHPLAPIPLRQKIHRPGDATAPHSESTAQVDKPRRVVPAQAGTHRPRECTLSMDSRLRGNDMMLVADTVLVAPVPDDMIAATIPDDAATRVP